MSRKTVMLGAVVLGALGLFAYQSLVPGWRADACQKAGVSAPQAVSDCRNSSAGKRYQIAMVEYQEEAEAWRQERDVVAKVAPRLWARTKRKVDPGGYERVALQKLGDEIPRFLMMDTADGRIPEAWRGRRIQVRASLSPKSLLSEDEEIDPARRYYLTNIDARDGAGPLPDRAYGRSEGRLEATTLLTTDIESLDRDDRQFADTVCGRFVYAGMGCDVTIYGSVTSVGTVYGPDGGAVMREPVFRAEAIQFHTPPDEYPFDPPERGEV